MKQKEIKIGIVGLGYVGLPLFVELSKYFYCVGYDNSLQRISELKKGIDKTQMVKSSDLKRSKDMLSSSAAQLEGSNIYIITVPTPINNKKQPDLSPVLSATKLIAKILKKGDLVIYESTVYPGLTEEVCVPILEQSKLKYRVDFECGYSPERINPGDKNRTLRKITKIISASSKKALRVMDFIYSKIIDEGVYKADSIKIAEAAKVIENTQRDINIALINELAIIFDKLNIPTQKVLEAAGTKWNFLKFEPGLVGGHCIGVDPYYLTYKSLQAGYTPNVILSGRKINDSMHLFVTKKIKRLLMSQNKKKYRIAILGLAFKENCNDLRNSKSINLINSLHSLPNTSIHYTDPYVEKEISSIKSKSFKRFEEFKISKLKYDVIIITVPHKQFLKKNINLNRKLNKTGFIFDIKGKVLGYERYYSL